MKHNNTMADLGELIDNLSANEAFWMANFGICLDTFKPKSKNLSTNILRDLPEKGLSECLKQAN